MHMKLVTLSWKNIWRNPLRSGIVTAAVAFGLMSGVFSVAFMNGMGIQSVSAVISRQTAHIQLHDSAFVTEPLPGRLLQPADSVIAMAKSFTAVKAVASRISVTAMATSAKTAVGVTVKGVIPEDERRISKLPDDIVEGTYFGVTRKNCAVIGRKLADKLGIRLNSKIVLTTQDINGELTGGAFKVVGIFETINSMFDESTVFVKKKDVAGLIGVPAEDVHEVALLCTRKQVVDSVAGVLQSAFPAVSVQTWNEIVPEIGMMESLMNQMSVVFVLVILIALSFGIVNTMLMAVLERRREFGMLMAVGMSSGRIFSMVLIETVMLSLSGGVIGMATGGLVVLMTNKTGVNLGMLGTGLKAIGYDPMVYPFIGTFLFSGISGMVVATAILAALYPALKAVALNPADAVRSDT